jgi:hypothetical protein
VDAGADERIAAGLRGGESIACTSSLPGRFPFAGVGPRQAISIETLEPNSPRLWGLTKRFRRGIFVCKETAPAGYVGLCQEATVQRVDEEGLGSAAFVNEV